MELVLKGHLLLAIVVESCGWSNGSVREECSLCECSTVQTGENKC